MLDRHKRIPVEPLPNADDVDRVNNLAYNYISSHGRTQVAYLSDFKPTNEEFERDLTTAETRKSQDLFEKNQWLFEPFPLPNKVLWDQFQTPIRNQKNRNTCAGFAMVAAIEARYLRDYDLELNLSEQFFWHCYKSTSLAYPRKYLYENQSSIWGGGSSHGVSIASNFSIPLESDCPYLDASEMQLIKEQIPESGQLSYSSDPAINSVTQDQVDAFEYSPLYIPHAARQKTLYGISEYALLEKADVTNVNVLETILSWGFEVIVSARLKWKSNSQTGIREYDANSNGGAHIFLIVGYDKNENVLFIKNSWGEQGFIKVTYEFEENCFSSGSVITKVTHPDYPTRKERYIGKWAMSHDGWPGELVVRRYSEQANEVTRLGHYDDRTGKIMSANGNYIDENTGIMFSLIDDPDSDPTATNGQQFHVNVFSWDIKQAAGHTTWQSSPFGTYLNREQFAIVSGSNFEISKWVGIWDMNHDGWIGELNITGVFDSPHGLTYVAGSYKTQNDDLISIFGIVDPTHNHIIHIAIPFSDQNTQSFVMHFHTWTENIASGYTFWGGKRFGAVASLQT